MLHRHSWKILAKTYTPPYSLKGPFQMSEWLLDRTVNGRTSFILSCEKCGATKLHEVVGKEVELPIPTAEELGFREV